MDTQRARRSAAMGLVLLASLLTAAPRPAAAAGSPTGTGTAAVIARYQERIPQLMAEQGVPGLSVAVTDGAAVLWAQGFGFTDRDGRAAITPDTVFSVQSMSKLFTATAVMRAAGEGRLDLDAPITTYLPDFTVHSAFEAQPERRITLRMLLSHTAGFTHEAPVGNNNELDPGTFDAHVRSISDTWLRFPVGTGYAYSNLGIDLAGYILETVEGKPFAQVMADTVLGPLGMTHSTFDRDRIRGTADRAVGHIAGIVPPVDIPMTAAGGLYASASDLARFLCFEVAGGTVDGRTVLDPALVGEMRTVPSPNAGAGAGYALGVERTRWRAERYQDLFFHGGGGYGFLSDLWWVPTLGLGIAVLTNSQDHQLQGDLAISIMRDLVDEPGSDYHARLQALPSQADVVDADDHYQAPAGMTDLIAATAMPDTSDQAARWATYAHAYRVPGWGVLSPTEPPDRFLVEAGIAWFETRETKTLVRHRLTELQPGLFLSDEGETLDLRGPQPTWRNLELVPVNDGPLPWQWATLVVVGVVALGWLAGGLAGTARGLRLRGHSPARPGRRWQRLTSAVAAGTALAVLATLALIVAVPGIVDAGFLGWLAIPLAQRLALHLPLAVAVLAACTAALAVIASRRGASLSRPARLRYLGLLAASAVLVAQLAAWHLVGWGFL